MVAVLPKNSAKLTAFILLFVTGSACAQNLDIHILRYLNSPVRNLSDKFFQFVSNSAVFLEVGIPVGIGTTGLIKQDDETVRKACLIVGAAAISSGITLAVKYSVNRKRPFVTYPDIAKKSAAGSPSFPSGHTSGAFSLATSLTLSYPKWYIIVPAYSWAGTVAFSRMDLGVHYPSDVLAGALIGSGSAWLTHYINKKLIFKSHKKPLM
jgi:membrane-associated phospholipid phosphatase